MSSTVRTCYCERCKQQVAFHYDPTNHITHLVITLCTCGFWLPIWLLFAWAPSWLKAKMCDRCNEPLWDR